MMDAIYGWKEGKGIRKWAEERKGIVEQLVGRVGLDISPLVAAAIPTLLSATEEKCEELIKLMRDIHTERLGEEAWLPHITQLSIEEAKPQQCRDR